MPGWDTVYIGQVGRLGACRARPPDQSTRNAPPGRRRGPPYR